MPSRRPFTDPLNRDDIVKILVITSVSAAYALAIAPMFEQRGIGFLYAAQTGCVVGCPANDCGRGRGSNYFIGDGPNAEVDNARIQSCLMTFWGLTHFAMHFLLGYVVPTQHGFVVSFVGGVLFELWEYSAHDCHDALDILYNTAGWYAGYQANVALTTTTD